MPRWRRGWPIIRAVNWFLLLKSLHVLSAIIAMGSNATYGLWSARARRDDVAQLGFALRGIKFIDDRMANPAYGVLLVTGLIMAFTTYAINRTWILTGLIIYAVVAATAGAVYTPSLRRQIAALETDGATSAAYKTADARARGAGIFMGVLLVGVVFVMVFKPQI